MVQDDLFFKPSSVFEFGQGEEFATFMRLPLVSMGEEKFSQVDVGLIAVPWDGGTPNRPGARHGPWQLRNASIRLREENMLTRLRPFELVNCADLGDVITDPESVLASMGWITSYYDAVHRTGIRPLSIGGDHLVTLPILRALGRKAPLGLIQFDAHTDLKRGDERAGLYNHATPFRRALEEGLIDPKRMVQIGIRGTSHDGEDREFARANGVRIITMEEYAARGSHDVMAEVREIVGQGATYVTFDVDFVDPCFAPGTGTPEVGGPNSFEAMQVCRALNGLNIVGADLVELSPPFDANGGTAWLAASILYEMLCSMVPGVARAQAFNVEPVGEKAQSERVPSQRLTDKQQLRDRGAAVMQRSM